MKRLISWVAVVGFAWMGCRPGTKAPSGTHRMEMRKVTNNSVQFYPSADQLPYCLVFTRSEQGVTRQLTMSKSNVSVPCNADEPVMGLRFRIPVDEGKVRAYTFFSDQRLSAARVAEQLTELLEKPAFNAMDLRLPGHVIVDVAEFVPAEEVSVVTGDVVPGGNPDGGTAAKAPPAEMLDAGTSGPDGGARLGQ